MTKIAVNGNKVANKEYPKNKLTGNKIKCNFILPKPYQKAKETPKTVTAKP